MKTLTNKLTTLLFYLSILFFFIGFNFTDNMLGNWYQQFMPNLNGMPISDITFIDSLNGFAITGDQTPNDTNYILKTTNGGDNWSIVYSAYRNHLRIKFLNLNTGFVCGGFNTSSGELIKTTNGGINWFALNTPGSIWYDDMSVLNEDTLWLVLGSSGGGGVFRTTNGGLNWQNQLSLGSQNPSKIYMFNARIGFVSSTAGLYKTTNSGINWFNASNDFSFSDMFFIDSLTGLKASGFMKKTTNGGMNWISQTLPSGGNIIVTSIEKFSNINRDTIWGVSGYANTGLGARGIIYRTTNGGSNWLFQIPDSTINIFRYLHIKFISKTNGWAYNPITGVHTTTGGDPVWYLGIQQISSNIPKDFVLKQNYPNPFNPRTVIPYSLKKAGYVKLFVYDILGRFTDKLVDQHQNAGEYETDNFIGKFAPSGVYFYRLEVDDKIIDTKKMVLVK
jgi:photosystem II stability/assembly factor-like uncharacterized protein